MSDDGWEDVAYGPPAAGGASADDGWEDVAFGPPAQPKVSKGLGMLRELGQGLTFDFADEAVARLSDFFHNQKTDRGVQVIQQALGYEPTFQLSSYDDRLAQERADRQSFSQEHPYMAAGANLVGTIAAPLPIAGEVKTVGEGIKAGAKIGALGGALSGFGGSEGGFENRALGAAQGGALGMGFGGATGAAGQWLSSSLAPKASEAADDIAKAQVGIGAAEKVKGAMRGRNWVDAEGNPVAADAASGIKTRLDDDWNLITKDGARISNNPQKTAASFAARKSELMDYTDAIENEANKLLAAKGGNGANVKFKPDLSEARAYAQSRAGHPDSAKLFDRIAEAEQEFSKTNRTLSDLIRVKRAWGKSSQRAWSGTDAANAVDPTLDRLIYSGFRKSIENNIDAIAGQGSPMVGKLKEANRLLSAYITFDKPLLKKAAKSEGILGNAVKSLGDLKTLAFGAGSMFGGPAAPAFQAAAAYRVAKSVAPMAVAAGYSGAGKALDKAGKVTLGLVKPASILSGRNMAEKDAKAQVIQPGAARSSATNSPVKVSDQPPLIRAIIRAESAGNPKAVSPVGAKGAMQLMDATGKQVLGQISPGEKYDPFNQEQNIRIGSAYINQLIQKYDGNIELALAAYNWGLGNLDKLIEKRKTTDFGQLAAALPKETKNYVNRIKNYLA